MAPASPAGILRRCLTPELPTDSGGIFRANPDGTDFDVIAWGLSNPQELAFDEHGDLCTANNHGDGGDKARWHYGVDGADFGWRIWALEQAIRDIRMQPLEALLAGALARELALDGLEAPVK